MQGVAVRRNWIAVFLAAIAGTSGGREHVLRFSTQGGGELPALAYGTAHIRSADTIAAALEVGFRHIDTAVLYGNHRAVGEAIQQSGLPRSEVFLTTKVSFWDKGGERVALQQSLAELNVSWIDLCLLHTPFTGSIAELPAAYLPHRLGRFQPVPWAPLRFLASPARKALGVLAALGSMSARAGAAARREAWRELEAAKSAGECRYIGVSNFDEGLLAEMEATAQVMPAVNQIELHARFQARSTMEFCRSKGIAVLGYGNGVALDLEQAKVVAANRSTGLSPAQAALAWTLQRGAGAVVRSSRREGMAQNLEALSVSLTESELQLLDAADEGTPFYWDVSAVPRQPATAAASAKTGDAEL